MIRTGSFSINYLSKKRRGQLEASLFSLYSFGPAERLFRIFREIGFRGSADRAFPVLRDVFERGSGLNAAIGIAFRRIIDPTATKAFVLFRFSCHNSYSFSEF